MGHTNRCNTWCFRLLGVMVAAMAGVSAPHAQSSGQAGNDAVYMYKGVDRDQQLADKAREEGKLVWYTSLAPNESRPMADAFEKEYGVKVELWRSTSDKVVQRTVAEGRAGRHAVDVVETNGPEVEMLAREKLLSEFYSPYLADLPEGAVSRDRLWVADRLQFFVVAYNTKLFKAQDIPKRYEGFLDPKWKGQIAVEATDTEWMAAVVKEMGEEKGMAFFDKLAAMKPDVRKGHVLLAEMVGAGEVPVALSAYNSNVESLKRRGAPVDLAPVQPVVGRPQGLAVARHAPHPHAALLFADFILSPKGQGLFNKMGRVPVSTKVKSNLNDFPYIMVDVATMLDESEKWEALWDKRFLEK